MNDAGMPSHAAAGGAGAEAEVDAMVVDPHAEAEAVNESAGDRGGEGENGVVPAGAASDDAADSADVDDDPEGDDAQGGDAEGGATEPAGAGSGVRRRGKARVALLEREGEVAADFLEKLLDIADLDGDIEVDIDGDRAAVAIVDSEEGRVPRRLVGPDGRVLDALQELTRLAVQTATGERSRLMLDVAGHRAARRAALVDLAKAAIAEVRESGAAKALANMSAFERKVVHDEVTAAGLVSESEGVEPHRHIVISPA
jgi:spoIIIJ-associated protein